MHSTIKRVVLYLAVAAALYGIATFFVDGRTAFIVVFGLGLFIGLTAELMFWFHLFRLPWKSRGQ
jgi:hypothetical protein